VSWVAKALSEATVARHPIGRWGKIRSRTPDYDRAERATGYCSLTAANAGADLLFLFPSQFVQQLHQICPLLIA
jgi:hypothetical protein